MHETYGNKKREPALGAPSRGVFGKGAPSVFSGADWTPSWTLGPGVFTKAVMVAVLYSVEIADIVPRTLTGLETATVTATWDRAANAEQRRSPLLGWCRAKIVHCVTVFSYPVCLAQKKISPIFFSPGDTMDVGCM